jgi:hypothetical protein
LFILVEPKGAVNAGSVRDPRVAQLGRHAGGTP